MDQLAEVMSLASSSPSNIDGSSAPASATTPSPPPSPRPRSQTQLSLSPLPSPPTSAPPSPPPPLSPEPLSPTTFIIEHCSHAITLHRYRDYREAQEVWIQLEQHFEADVESQDNFLGMLFRTTRQVLFPISEEMPSALGKISEARISDWAPGLRQRKLSRRLFLPLCELKLVGWESSILHG